MRRDLTLSSYYHLWHFVSEDRSTAFCHISYTSSQLYITGTVSEIQCLWRHCICKVTWSQALYLSNCAMVTNSKYTETTLVQQLQPQKATIIFEGNLHSEISKLTLTSYFPKLKLKLKVLPCKEWKEGPVVGEAEAGSGSCVDLRLTEDFGADLVQVRTTEHLGVHKYRKLVREGAERRLGTAFCCATEVCWYVYKASTLQCPVCSWMILSVTFPSNMRVTPVA